MRTIGTLHPLYNNQQLKMQSHFPVTSLQRKVGSLTAKRPVRKKTPTLKVSRFMLVGFLLMFDNFCTHYAWTWLDVGGIYI